MNNDVVISVEHVSKKYCKSLKRSMFYGMMDIGRNLLGRSSRPDVLRKDEFWALDDISLEVKKGETIGIIGPNGSGKTTLLKLLNGIFWPDKGKITIKGKVGALIELGAGFHPMLTGRENIYINAAILGMTKIEVDKRFDEIVEFADIGDFLDTPVKFYSSGMFVRLGFAIAVHCEPDILLVDEVLAVGDTSFKRSCFEKLNALRNKGIPWVLVSHDLGTIRNQAHRAIFLKNGRIEKIGNTNDVISSYLYSISEDKYHRINEDRQGIKGGAGDLTGVNITKVTLLDEYLTEKEEFQTGQPLVIKIDYFAHVRAEQPVFGVAIHGYDNICYSGTNTRISGYEIESIEGPGSIFFKLQSLSLYPGLYSIRVAIHDKNMGIYDDRRNIACLKVKEGNFGAGMFYMPHCWSLISADRRCGL